MVAIDIQKISKWYGSFQVLKNCSTKVDKGEVVVVCGPSGSGKSTLMKTVNALEPFQSGTIIVMPSWASSTITSNTSLIISGSSAEVGSSNSMAIGSMHNALAMATRCCCPPDSCPGNLAL